MPYQETLARCLGKLPWMVLKRIYTVSCSEILKHSSQVFRMTRLTFGVASSPYLATQVLHQLAADYHHSRPQYHVSSLHSGLSVMLGILSSTHYVIGGRQLIQDVTRRCIICCKHYAKTSSPLMGVLPTPRVSLSPPFTETGLDFAGPITLWGVHNR